MLIITPEIHIPDTEFDFSFARSSGPGGQNVNKVNSKVVLRWNPLLSGALSDAVRARFFLRFGEKITSDGSIIITSDRYRDQIRNRQDCLNKLQSLVLAVAHPPKIRRKTRPTRSSVEVRKKSKRLHGEKKKRRARIHDED
jgi:ribosome-associated protein